MRILVTGASGLLGLNLALQASGEHQVTGVIHRQGLRDAPFALVTGDLTEPEMIAPLLEKVQPDVVIHTAAMANIDACESQPALARRINAELPGWLAAACRKQGVKLGHISTDAVFDGARGDYTEEDAPNPLSVYANTKLEGERAVAEVNPDALVARVNFYGWSLNGRRSLAEFFFNHLQAGEPAPGFTDVFFCPLFVNDLGRILLDMLEKGLNGLYHVVSRECLSKYEFGVRLARAFGWDERLVRPTSVVQSGLQARRSPRLTLRCDKLARALGSSLPDQAEGLERFADLYRQGYPARIRAMRA